MHSQEEPTPHPHHSSHRAASNYNFVGGKGAGPQDRTSATKPGDVSRGSLNNLLGSKQAPSGLLKMKAVPTTVTKASVKHAETPIHGRLMHFERGGEHHQHSVHKCKLVGEGIVPRDAKSKTSPKGRIKHKINVSNTPELTKSGADNYNSQQGQLAKSIPNKYQRDEAVLKQIIRNPSYDRKKMLER